MDEDLKENKWMAGILPDILDDDSLSEIIYKAHISACIPSKNLPICFSSIGILYFELLHYLF